MASITLNNGKLRTDVEGFGVHPQRFAMWLAMAVMAMMFAGLTSAYLVRKGAPNWTEFKMPNPFFVSGIISIVSSIAITAAVRFWKANKIGLYKLSLAVTLLLALGFVGSQWMGWQELKAIGMYLDGNPSGSFMYVLSYMHVVHVGVGVLLIAFTLIRAFVLFGDSATVAKWQADDNKKIGIELLATYWHFVGALWIYLLIFFKVS